MDRKQARLKKLREHASKILQEDPPKYLYAGKDKDATLEELHLHQIEVDLQLEEMNRAYAALESAQQRYSRLFDGTSIAYFTVNIHGLIVTANQAAGQLLGHDPHELHGKRFVTYIAKDFRNIYYSVNKLVRAAQESQCYEMEVFHKDGTKQLVIVNADMPDPISDEVLLAITKLPRPSHDETLLSNTDLGDEANLLRLATLASLAPEFRKPLAAILSSVELLQKYGRKLSDNKRSQVFHTVRNLVWYLNDAVHDAGTIQELDKSQLFDTENFDVLAYTQQVISDVEVFAEGQAINLQMTASSNDVNIRWNINLYRRILMNLLGSLLKYSNEPIYCSLEVRDTSFSLSIETQAASLLNTELEPLFDSFYKHGNSASIRARGNGMMLVYDTVRSHGGTMRLLSKGCKGVGFYITLPRVQINPSPYTQ